MNEEITLVFKFINTAGKKEDFVLKNIKKSVSDEEINVYADKIIRNEYLVSEEGTKFVSLDEVNKITLIKEKIM